MRYVEITIWHPLDALREEGFGWIPKFSLWHEKDGFNLEWLFLTLIVSWHKSEEPADWGDRYPGEVEE